MLVRRNKREQEAVEQPLQSVGRIIRRKALVPEQPKEEPYNVLADKPEPIKPEQVYDPSAYDPDLLPPYQIYEPLDYRDGPEGFISWVEDNVCIPVYPDGSDIPVWTPVRDLEKGIHPKSGKSYDYIWEMQKEEVRKCLRMVHGRFVYRLIIFCWMRGEGKSLLACLVQLWKFFCWPKQNIVLGANSKDQSKFVHYDVMKDIIKNSPKLLAIVGERNIQEKEVRLRDTKGNITSVLRALSSFSGIVSNITGYTFSEMFDMNNPKFFTQLDGSIRNIPNALGVIDSTVSAKTHILYKMYLSYIKREIKSLFFSYRCSKNADIADYWNPQMDQQQLDDYKAKFLPNDFDMYFRNVWGSNAQQIFSPEMIEATKYFGTMGKIAPHSTVMELVQKKVKIMETIKEMTQKKIPSAFREELEEIKKCDAMLWPVDKVYQLRDKLNMPRSATIADLDALSDLYDTHWALGIGLDRADPLKKDRTAARTIVSLICKGLPSSRSNPLMADNGNPQYIYIRLNLAHISSSLLEEIKEVILEAHEEFDGVDAICGERWGIWDMAQWCEDNNIKFDPIHPSYDKQKAAFAEYHGAISTGRFKTPPLSVSGSKEEDIFVEEAGVFFHDEDKHWFGSPEKMEKYGIQDDVMFADAWTIFGLRDFKCDHFRERNHQVYFGTMVKNTSLLVKH